MNAILKTIVTALAEWAFLKLYRFGKAQYRKMRSHAQRKADARASAKKAKEAHDAQSTDDAIDDQLGSF